MSDERTKIRLKIGTMEVEYEGKDSFLKDDLSSLLDTMSDFFKAHRGTVESNEPAVVTQESEGTKAPKDQIDLSVNSIASKMNVKTGPDLAVAACGYLTLVKGRERCSRAELLATMKNASSYYKATMGSNLSSHLGRLVKSSRLNQTASDAYALTANEKKKIEDCLA